MVNAPSGPVSPNEARAFCSAPCQESASYDNDFASRLSPKGDTSTSQRIQPLMLAPNASVRNHSILRVAIWRSPVPARCDLWRAACGVRRAARGLVTVVVSPRGVRRMDAAMRRRAPAQLSPKDR